VRFGLVVATLDGREILAINPDGRFVPASNTKLFTTIAAYELLPGLDQPDAASGARVLLRPATGKAPDVILEGRGDARLSSAPDCRSDCLATLADAVAARTRRVGAVIGDARASLDERWSFGMSWNNIPTRSGTALSALMIDGNEAALRVDAGRPGAAAGRGRRLSRGRQRGEDGGRGHDRAGRAAASRKPAGATVGHDQAGETPQLLRLGIDDPAYYSAWALARMLEARGVRVEGGLQAAYRPALDEAVAIEGAEVARLAPEPLGADIVTINKVSQNVHAELLLRRLGAARGKPSVAGGLEAVRDAGPRRRARARGDARRRVGHVALQPGQPARVVTCCAGRQGGRGGTTFRASLPIGGVDGTLRNRFQARRAERAGVRQDRLADRGQRLVRLPADRARRDAGVLGPRQRRSRGRARHRDHGRGAGTGRRQPLTPCCCAAATASALLLENAPSDGV
jgi:D-alanyl-D-alanine carboxypeptidase/D-alanyl-D-alanine-endopeptidase (penicillin-binding protein 4)